MRSKVKLMLQGDEDQQTLLDFVDAAMRNSEQKSLLEVGLDYLALLSVKPRFKIKQSDTVKNCRCCHEKS